MCFFALFMTAITTSTFLMRLGILRLISSFVLGSLSILFSVSIVGYHLLFSPSGYVLLATRALPVDSKYITQLSTHWRYNCRPLSSFSQLTPRHSASLLWIAVLWISPPWIALDHHYHQTQILME